MSSCARRHEFTSPTRQHQPDHTETDTSARQEDPVVRRNVERHVPHVVDVQQVMIDHALNEVE
jgi:hypothetical protein